MKCEVCDTEGHGWSWTDVHGVAQCGTCGTPYRLYHYDGDKRVQKPPEILLKPEFVEVVRSFWKETGRCIPSGHSVPGGQEMATDADKKFFAEWWEEHVNKAAKESQ